MEQIDLNKDIDAAVSILDDGGVILYPTDTVWGIGCDACNPAAVEKVYRIKNRPDSKALITLVGSVGDLHRWVEDVPPVAGEMIAASERPVTVVFDKGRGLAPNLLAADGSVGLRVTSELYSRALCERLGRPVVSTSANVSGEPSPAFYAEISPEILSRVDYVASFRRDDTVPRQPSKVVKISSDGTVKILRS